MEDTPKRAVGFEAEELGGELLLYDPKGERILHMNSTCSLVWQLCDGSNTVKGMIKLLRDAYPEAEDQIHADVLSALENLAQHGALSTISTSIAS